MSLAVHAFEEDAPPAQRLATALGAPFQSVLLHEFPDGETLPTVTGVEATVLVYRSLDRPNGKLAPLLLACDAWRRAGVRRLVLVAPYMCYLRQDTLFGPGQAVSRDVIGELLGGRFDRIVTVDPHLHRTPDLAAAFQGAEVTTLAAAPALAAALGSAGEPVVVGPDSESAPWVTGLAGALAAPHLVLEKRRTGDREVSISLPPGGRLAERRVVLVDDICASGATLELATRRVREAGARSIEIAVTHAMFDRAAAARLKAAGAGRMISTDSCRHPTNGAPLAPLLAQALSNELDRRWSGDAF